MFTAPNIFGVDDDADEAIQMELIILLRNSVLKKNLVTSDCPGIHIYLPAHRFPKYSVCL
jgi:hypothetical protein